MACRSRPGAGRATAAPARAQCRRRLPTGPPRRRSARAPQHRRRASRGSATRSPSICAYAPTGSEQPAPSSARKPRSASTAARVPASSMARSRSMVSVSSSRHCTAIAPWPGDGRNSSASKICVASSRRPRRSSPAAARTTASYSPLATFSIRVSTLPRISTTSMSGRSTCSSRRRRTELVPTRAPAGSSARRRPPDATSTSRGSPRVRIAASVSPSTGAVGTSLSECMAMSARPSRSASSTARTNTPRPPIWCSGEVRSASPSVRTST